MRSCINMAKVCLVLEGGGNRGAYTSGVLDALLDNKIFINDIYAVSAGALNALSYLSRQVGRSNRINKKYIFNPKCINYKKIISSGNVLNLDYLLNEVNIKEDVMDFEEFNKNNSNFVVVATNVENGAPYYKKIEDYSKDYSYIKASASLPLFTKIVKVDGLKLLDGGISDSIPIIKAIEDGYDKVVVVLTRHKEFVCQPYKMKKLYNMKYRNYPKFLETMNNRHNKYNVTRDIIDKLEKESKLLAIYPSEPILINNLERDENKIDYIYKLGYEDAKKMIKEIIDFIRGDLNEKKQSR